jgi:F-type H+-transporting ATPase subunit delta
MGPSIIARNYAETLFDLAMQHGGMETVDRYLLALDEVAELIESDPRIGEFLATPRVDVDTRKSVIRDAFAGRVPENFLRFLLIVVEKRRQTLLPVIATEFHELVDQAHNRLRAEIVVAAEPGSAGRAEIVETLERKLGRHLLPTFRVDTELIGGVVVRIGDRVVDGSLRRRMADLRRRLLSASLPVDAV